MEVTNTDSEVVRMRGGIAIGPGRTATVPLDAFQLYMRTHPGAGGYLKIRPSLPAPVKRVRYGRRRR